MQHKFLFSTALVSASLMGLTPALADFTPMEALERYFDTAEAMGSTVTVDLKEENGETVRWTGITITDEASGSISTMEWLEASPLSDDEVQIVLGSKMTIEGKDPNDDVPEIALEMDLINNQVIMSEADDLVNATYSGERLTLTSTSDDPDMPLNIDMTVADLMADYALKGEERVDGSASSGPLTISYGIDDDDLSFTSDITMGSMSVSFGANLPKDGDPSGFMSEGNGSAMSYSFKDIASNTKFNTEDGAGYINSMVDLSAGSFSVNSDAVEISGESQNVRYVGQPPMPGFPEMSASMASATMDMNLSVANMGEEGPMAIALTLEELVLDDSIWGMFDPSGAIPRDPATLRLDLGADALWITDGIESSLNTGQPPFMPQSMALNELFLTVGGATLSATGEGILSQQTGQPSGTATVELKGVLGLINTLSEIGLIPIPQAMMAQGMLPQFTRPGPDGADHLISDIEAMPDGSILVNGTRVK